MSSSADFRMKLPPVGVVLGWHRHHGRLGGTRGRVISERRVLLHGHRRVPGSGQQWILFHGHGQLLRARHFLLANGYRTTFEPLARGRPSPHRSAKANSGKLSRRRRSMRGARKAKAEESLKQGRCGTNRKS